MGFPRGKRGVSGHAAYGAVPFLSIAHQTEDPWRRTGWLLMAMTPGLARLNDDKHYFSQVFIGYALAYLSSLSVARID